MIMGHLQGKECQGLGELAEIENALTRSMRMAFNTWQPGIDQVQKIAQLRTNRFTYPADLENQARSAVIHLDYPAFTSAFSNLWRQDYVKSTARRKSERFVSVLLTL